MKDLAGNVAIVTGASRGIGTQIAEALAQRGVRVVLAARSGEELTRVCAAMVARGATALAIPTDITDESSREHLVTETLRTFGAVDLLINNAGVVVPAAYDCLPLEDVKRHIAVNLEAPMMLTHRLLPLMRQRNRGHIVNVSSLGGLLGIGLGEPYSATKHGLVGFTRSLRISCRTAGSRVSASVVCPGFIDDVGMYADKVGEHGHQAPFLLGTSSPAAVIKAIFRAIEKDLPEVIVSSRPVRMLVAINAISPRLGEWLVQRVNAHLVFAGIAQATGLVHPLPETKP